MLYIKWTNALEERKLSVLFIQPHVINYSHQSFLWSVKEGMVIGFLLYFVSMVPAVQKSWILIAMTSLSIHCFKH